MTKYHKNGNICPTYHSTAFKWIEVQKPNYAWVQYVVVALLVVVIRFLCCG